MYSGTHDEKGYYLKHKSSIEDQNPEEAPQPPYWEEPRGDNYDEKVRSHVYMMLKYAGNMQHMIRSEYHTDAQFREEFWYRASEKLPFYYLLKVSPPEVRKMMLEKYLENPLNPLMFIEYD